MATRDILQNVLESLWDQYRHRVKYAATYQAIVEDMGGQVANDHIAFRSFAVDSPWQLAGIDAFSRIFVPLGYAPAGSYAFSKKRLTAKHFEHPDESMPRIFVSQMEIHSRTDWSHYAKIVKGVLGRNYDEAKAIRMDAEALAMLRAADTLSSSDADDLTTAILDFFRRPWSPPIRSEVLELNEVSQYGAWTLLHGNTVNHFTAYINKQGISEWSGIDKTVTGLREAGVPMKDNVEGEIGSKLRQSSTKAVEGDFDVTEDDGSLGTLRWTYAYYELAERGMVEGPDGEAVLFTGFLGEQATHLFDMTTKQVPPDEDSMAEAEVGEMLGRIVSAPNTAKKKVTKKKATKKKATKKKATKKTRSTIETICDESSLSGDKRVERRKTEIEAAQRTNPIVSTPSGTASSQPVAEITAGPVHTGHAKIAEEAAKKKKTEAEKSSAKEAVTLKSCRGNRIGVFLPDSRSTQFGP